MANIFRPSTWLRARKDRSQRFDGEAALDEASEPARSLEESADGRSPARDERTVAQRIEERAYRKWCDEGCPSGRDVEIWLAAEREVLEEINRGVR